jgi:lipoyl(octanoyl) transferase
MQFWSLRTAHSDYTTYEQVRELQLKLVDERAQDKIPDTILFLEHESVVTRGRGLQFTGEVRPRHMPMVPLPPEIAFSESERGGDLTYHGPGQLVIYPICKLDGQGVAANHDVTAFLRWLESVVIAELDGRFLKIGARCEGIENATGVWVRANPERKTGKKIASIGIAVRKWVTYHGLALNCVNELQPFQLISPCGFAPEVMTRVKDWIELDPRGWRSDFEQSLAKRFLQSLESRPGHPVHPHVESKVI